MLDSAPAPEPVVNTETVQAAPEVQVQGDAFEGAAERLFPNDVPKPATPMVDDLKPGEPAPTPADETPEAKAAREAAAKPAETPEEKAAREAAETPEQKTAREAKEAEDAKKAAGAPETYEPFKLPEGTTIDPEVDTQFRTVAKELNLTQDQAQKLIDLQNTANTKAAEAAATANQTMRADWQNQVKTDKEFGGDKLNQSLATAQKAIKQFGDPALNELMSAGLGDHPAFIRFAIKVGAAISEASIVTGAKPANSTPESVLYPSLK